MNKGMKKWSLIALLLSGVSMPVALEAKTVMKAAAAKRRRSSIRGQARMTACRHGIR